MCHLLVSSPFIGGRNSDLLLGTEADEHVEEAETEYERAVLAISPQVFCHSKLNQFLMKNIQDPYNLMGDVISG